MRVPGFKSSKPRVVVDPATGREFVEQKPGVIVSDGGVRHTETIRPTVVERQMADTTIADRTAVDRTVVDDGRIDRRAYEAGRADAARAPRRRGFPLLALLVLVIAAVGVAWLVLSAREGSFAAGGAVVDRKLSAATSDARAVVDDAKTTTGQAVENAGQAISNQGEKIKR